MLLNSVGMMGEMVVLGWLALELTNSPFLVGIALGMRMLPLFFVGVPAGVIADRLPRHRVLVATSVGQAITSAVIGVLAVLGTVQLGHVLVLTFAAGIVRGIEQAARQSYTHDVVGGARLMDGLALLGVAMRAGWMAGSLGAGAAIAHLGSGTAYLVVAASYLLAAIALLPASPATAAPTRAHGSVWQSLTGFVAALRDDATLPALMILTAAAETLGFSHQVVLPSLARDVLHVGPEGLGVMNASRSLGGILGLFVVAGRFPLHGGGRLFVAAVVAFGAGLVGLGIAPQFMGLVGVVAVLIIVNAVGALSDLLAQSLIQLSVPHHLRGRAGGAWVVAIGLGPLGQFEIGGLASLFGVGIALAASGVGLVAVAGATLLAFPRLRRI